MKSGITMYWTLFLTFVKIGTFTIGGGYAMLPLIQREVVDRGWLSKEDFVDIFAVTQSLPGIFAVNISIFVGYRLKKNLGAICCALGTILPSFLIILAIALFFTHVRDNVWVEKAFKGLRPAVVALIVVPCLTTARAIKLSRAQILLPVAAALLIWLGGVSPAWIILAAILGFGGGYAMLSLIQADVVDKYGWITLQEFTDIVAISQMTPGPIGINSATYIGYTAIHNAGYSPAMAILGSCLTTFAVCFPSFLLVLLISYSYARFRNNKYVEAAFLGLRPVTVGLIAAAALLLMNQENFIDYKSFLIFGAAFILTLKFKVHPILMILLAGVAGMVIY